MTFKKRHINLVNEQELFRLQFIVVMLNCLVAKCHSPTQLNQKQPKNILTKPLEIIKLGLALSYSLSIIRSPIAPSYPILIHISKFESFLSSHQLRLKKKKNILFSFRFYWNYDVDQCFPRSCPRNNYGPKDSNKWLTTHV